MRVDAFFLAAVLAAGALLPTTAFADPAPGDPGDQCTAALQRAAGSHAKCLLDADARLSVSDDLERHQDRVDRCEHAFERQHARVLGRFGADRCPADSADDITDVIFESTASISLAAAGPGSAGSLGPMKVRVKGVNYEPAPSNYTCCPPPSLYFDTDFYNQDFVQLWGTGTPPSQPGGRNDTGDMASLGVNFIRVFNWNPTGRNHGPWLEDLAGKGIYAAGVFSNGNRATAQAQLVVNEFNGFSSAARNQVAVWLIGNEISPTDPFTPQTLAVIQASAQAPLDTIPICVPFQMASTQDALNKIQTNYQQQFVPVGLQARFIACLNFYGLGMPASEQAPEDQLESFIQGFFADSFVQANDIQLLLTEFGINFDNSNNIQPNAGGDAALQGTYLGDMLARSIALQARYPGFLGQAVFEYTNETWKTPLTEASFGLYSLTPQNPPTGTTTSGASYPVDARAARPQHQAVVAHY